MMVFTSWLEREFGLAGGDSGTALVSVEGAVLTLGSEPPGETVAMGAFSPWPFALSMGTLFGDAGDAGTLGG